MDLYKIALAFFAVILGFGFTANSGNFYNVVGYQLFLVALFYIVIKRRKRFEELVKVEYVEREAQLTLVFGVLAYVILFLVRTKIYSNFFYYLSGMNIFTFASYLVDRDYIKKMKSESE